ncbi:LysR substrate-binding domain-containing protein [Mangrovicoccus sp. HB161399]|uniref:LysR substrate-binding domain-containing protein n=1 Tax=Mangrovicoccus sp. HB161399 TaxID=2720392 RepID=UPI0020A64A2F|nr:LysR substrate-binding domain-containing protein [Mangrovicoccus sp. HB161399]
MAARTLNLDALRSFVAIHDTGSFRLAAARVNLSPSAVSLQIARLEDALGHRLLERNARRVALTRHGELLLRQARDMLSLSDETLALFRRPALEGLVSVAAPHDLGVSLLPGLLRRIAGDYPELRVDVRLGTAARVAESFREGACNLALFNDVGPAALPCDEIRSDPLCWLTARGGRAADTDPLPLAAADPGCAWRRAALEALDTAGRRYRIAYGSDTAMGQVAALRADLAIAALPRSLAGRDLEEVPASAGLPALPLTHVRVAHDGGGPARAIAAALLRDPGADAPW